MNAIVTGGAGFIGSHLCAALLERKLAVTCIDNLTTGTWRNLAAIQSDPHFRFIQHDITLPLPDDVWPDYIFHLASPASVVDYLDAPIETLQTNSLGTLQMLKLARASGASFLLTSTSEIYGEPLIHPQPETYWGNVNPIGPRACYDESKRFAEMTAIQYWRTYGVDARVVRIFNTYGPHSRPNDGRIIPNFITQALEGKPITIYGDGTQTRSLCYVSDLVRGLLAAMFEPGTTGDVFNLGNPAEHTVLEYASIIASVFGSDAGFVYQPLPVNDPSRRCPDITKARRILGWEPVVELGAGIERTGEWFRSSMSSSPIGG